MRTRINTKTPKRLGIEDSVSLGKVSLTITADNCFRLYCLCTVGTLFRIRVTLLVLDMNRMPYFLTFSQSTTIGTFIFSPEQYDKYQSGYKKEKQSQQYDKLRGIVISQPCLHFAFITAHETPAARSIVIYVANFIHRSDTTRRFVFLPCIVCDWQTYQENQKQKSYKSIH